MSTAAVAAAAAATTAAASGAATTSTTVATTEAVPVHLQPCSAPLKSACANCSRRRTPTAGTLEVSTAIQERTEPTQTFYRRPLPPQLVDFSSALGRDTFKRAIQGPYMQCYFGLASNYMTQSEPAYCGISCLAMVLNTLEVDPKRTWKGVWRWYSEEMLDCCAPLPRVKAEGITFLEFACLAQCNGLTVDTSFADEGTRQSFKEALMDVCSSRDRVLVVAHSRTALDQTGDGHFSPVGGFDAESDMVLLMDVARFKYPPFWVSLDMLWESLKPLDAKTGRSRGYFVLSRPDGRPSLSLLKLELDQQGWARLAADLKDMRAHFASDAGESARTIEAIILRMFSLLGFPASTPLLFRNFADNEGEMNADAEMMEETIEDETMALCTDVRMHPLYEIVSSTLAMSKQRTSVLPPRTRRRFDVDSVLGTVLMLALPLWVSPLATDPTYLALHHYHMSSKKLRNEVSRLRHQLASLEAHLGGECTNPV